MLNVPDFFCCLARPTLMRCGVVLWDRLLHRRARFFFLIFHISCSFWVCYIYMFRLFFVCLVVHTCVKLHICFPHQYTSRWKGLARRSRRFRPRVSRGVTLDCDWSFCILLLWRILPSLFVGLTCGSGGAWRRVRFEGHAQVGVLSRGEWCWISC